MLNAFVVITILNWVIFSRTICSKFVFVVILFVYLLYLIGIKPLWCWPRFVKYFGSYKSYWTLVEKTRTGMLSPYYSTEESSSKAFYWLFLHRFEFLITIYHIQHYINNPNVSRINLNSKLWCKNHLYLCFLYELVLWSAVMRVTFYIFPQTIYFFNSFWNM